MNAFLLEVTLRRRFIFRFIWDNDLFFADILVMQSLTYFLKMASMLSKNASEKTKSVSFSKACPLPRDFSTLLYVKIHSWHRIAKQLDKENLWNNPETQMVC